MELRLSVGSKSEKLSIPSPVKKNSVTVNGVDHSVAGLAVKSLASPPRFRNDGSKEEAFFDSQPWLESDCEDDFLSVNGDFMPSSGNTPVHNNFFTGNPTVNNSPFLDGPLASATEPSPSDKKKRLSELFKESLHIEDTGGDENEASDDSMMLENIENNGRTPNGVLRAEEESEKSTQCCLPLRSSCSFSEKRKKMSPPIGNR